MGSGMAGETHTQAGYRGGGGPGSRGVISPGVWVDDSDEDDPVLRNADGSLVDTWRQDYEGYSRGRPSGNKMR